MLNRILNIIRILNNNTLFRKAIRDKKGRILSGVKIHISGNFNVGSNITIGAKGIDLFEKSQIHVARNANLIIGDNVGMTNVSIFCIDSISIGNYVKIGAGCLLFDSNFHSTDWNFRMDPNKDTSNARTSTIIIKDHCFIGARCIIQKGVTIGARTIIAAGSVVTRSIPDDCIAGGNPCKVIKTINKDA